VIGRRDGSHSPQKNNSIKDSEGDKENGYAVHDPNKTMISDTKEPTMPTNHPQRRNH
jgi:hypothetical protein